VLPGVAGGLVERSAGCCGPGTTITAGERPGAAAEVDVVVVAVVLVEVVALAGAGGMGVGS
jgi:hypothetical protein